MKPFWENAFIGPKIATNAPYRDAIKITTAYRFTNLLSSKKKIETINAVIPISIMNDRVFLYNLFLHV